MVCPFWHEVVRFAVERWVARTLSADGTGQGIDSPGPSIYSDFYSNSNDDIMEFFMFPIDAVVNKLDSIVDLLF